MGVLHDMAVLIGNGMKVDEIRELINMEKEKDEKREEASADIVTKSEEIKPETKDGSGESEKDATSVQTPVDDKDERIAELEAQVKRIQEENRHKDVSVSVPTDEDILNGIMLDMF